MDAPGQPRILFLQGTSEFGGSKRSLLDTLEILVGTGGRAAVATPHEGWLTRQLEPLGVPFLLLPFPAWRKWLDRPRFGWKLRRHWLPALAPERFDLVHSNEFWWAPHAVWLGRHLGIPALVHLRDGHHTLAKARQYRVPDAAHILAVSSELKNQFQADAALHQRTSVLFNSHRDPLASSTLAPAAARQQLGLPLDGMVVANIGRLCERKNQRFLLRAIARLRDSGRWAPCHVLLVGDGDQDYAAAVQQDVAVLDLQGVVRCVGPVDNIAPVYAAIDLLVHCASREGLPRVVPEAMLAGRPVVATAAEGVRDAIPDDRFGAVVSLGDADALGAALGQFLGDPELRWRVGQAARARAQTEFSMAAHRRRLLALYNRWLKFEPAAAVVRVAQRPIPACQVPGPTSG